MALERVQKILAQAGIASRRKAEELIEEGLVTINGKRAQLGDKAERGKDSIKVNGKLLHQTESLVYLALNKPKAVLSTLADPEGRPTLKDLLQKVRTRVFPIGRLDFNSEGLILLTNDGAFAEKLQKNDDIPRIYSVKIRGRLEVESQKRLEKGAWLGENRKRQVKPHSIRIKQELHHKSVIEVVMMGSGAFDIKALFESKGLLVEKVVRTGIGHLSLKGIESGHFRYLKASQVFALLEQPELGMRKLQEEAEKGAVVLRKKNLLREKNPRPRKGAAPVITPVRKGSSSNRKSGPTRKTAVKGSVRIISMKEGRSSRRPASRPPARTSRIRPKSR